MFWRYKGLLPIIRFQDFFPLCLWCVTPKSAWRAFSCGSRPSDIQTALKKKAQHESLGKMSVQWQQWHCIPNMKMCHRNYFTGIHWCWKATGRFSSCQHNKCYIIINDGVKKILIAHCCILKRKLIVSWLSRSVIMAFFISWLSPDNEGLII